MSPPSWTRVCCPDLQWQQAHPLRRPATVPPICEVGACPSSPGSVSRRRPGHLILPYPLDDWFDGRPMSWAAAAGAARAIDRLLGWSTSMLRKGALRPSEPDGPAAQNSQIEHRSAGAGSAPSRRISKLALLTAGVRRGPRTLFSGPPRRRRCLCHLPAAYVHCGPRPAPSGCKPGAWVAPGEAAAAVCVAG